MRKPLRIPDTTKFYALSAGDAYTFFDDMQETHYSNSGSQYLGRQNPFDGVISLRAYPVKFHTTAGYLPGVTSTGSTPISVLRWVMTNARGHKLSGIPQFKLAVFNVPRKFGSFLDFAPYTAIKLWLPMYGVMELPPQQVVGKKLTVWATIDLTTGGMGYEVRNDTDNVLVTAVTCQGAIEVPLVKSNRYEAVTQLSFGLGQAEQNATFSAIGGAVAGGGIGAAVGAGIGFVSSLVSSLKQFVLAGCGNQLQLMREGTSLTATTHDMAPYMIIERVRPVIPSSFNRSFGRPSSRTARLRDLRGYTEVAQVHVEGIAATRPEVEQIEALLKSGVIL